MLQSNEYFSGKVKSIGFSSSSTGRASVGVMVEGEYLRIAAYGPHAANVVGLTDQTDLFYTMKAALGLK